MHDTLVNHKRAMLMEHKVQSSVLQQDLAALVEQKDEIEAQRMAVLKEASRLEGAVKEIEHQMYVEEIGWWKRGVSMPLSTLV